MTIRNILSVIVGNATLVVRSNSHIASKPNAASLWDEPDMFMQDTKDDHGDEPNSTGASLVHSKDIWIRYFADGIEEHQPPKYANIAANYNRVYVKVRNRGCVNTGDAVMRTYWTIARSQEMWEHDWINYQQDPVVAGTNYVNTSGTDYPLGGEITINTPFTSAYDYSAPPLSGISTDANFISPLGPGEVRTLNPFGWRAPNPDWYPNAPQMNNGRPVICLLARIESTGDPMFNEFAPRDVYWNVHDNNNIITLNTFLATPTPSYYYVRNDGHYGSGFGTVMINNATSAPRVVNLSFVNESDPLNPDYNSYGEITFAIEDGLRAIWESGGSQSTGLLYLGGGLFRVTDPQTATLDNLMLPPYSMYQAGIEFVYYSHVQPASDLFYGFQLGEYEGDPSNQINTPSVFETHVLASPSVEPPPVEDPEPPVVIEGLTSTGKQVVHNGVDFKVYPNPAENNLNLNFKLNTQSPVTVKLYDHMGKCVRTFIENKTFTSGIHQLHLSVSDLAAGVYMCEVAARQGTSVQKITIAK